MLGKIWVGGHPATFSTRKEKPWRESLASQLPLCETTGEEKGLIARFCLDAPAPQGQPLDVDNLMEPLLSVLVNGKGWFGGRRTALGWWRATKEESQRAGCELEISERLEPPDLFPVGTGFILDGTYHGRLPRDAKDEAFASWADTSGSKLGRARGYYGVKIRFEGGYVNIGEVASGAVKGTVDCLQPILGGEFGRPQDWRIRRLQVEKALLDSPEEGVSVMVAPESAT